MERLRKKQRVTPEGITIQAVDIGAIEREQERKRGLLGARGLEILRRMRRAGVPMEPKTIELIEPRRRRR